MRQISLTLSVTHVCKSLPVKVNPLACAYPRVRHGIRVRSSIAVHLFCMLRPNTWISKMLVCRGKCWTRHLHGGSNVACCIREPKAHCRNPFSSLLAQYQSFLYLLYSGTAADCSLPGYFQGQVLNQTSAWWMQHTQHITPNALLSTPDPNVSVMKKCAVFPVEFVVRGFLTGGASRPDMLWGSVANKSC